MCVCVCVCVCVCMCACVYVCACVLRKRMRNISFGSNYFLELMKNAVKANIIEPCV